MSIPATEAVSTGMYVPADQAPAAGGEDKQMFLQLLVAQLRYQDPMNPTDSSQFLAQSAQFTSLEKMQDVADQTAALLNAQVAFGASGMVGKQVTYLDSTGAPAHGLVQSVTYGGPTGPMLSVGDQLVTLGQVQSISATTPTTTGTTADPAPSGTP